MADIKMVVGLGNPGSRYEGTRHNVGFAVIDALAEGPSAGKPQHKFHADIAELREGETRVLLVKPMTFMNLSGQSVRQVLDFYKVEPENLLIVCDDINLPLGKLRFRARGTHGGHNGLRNIQDQLGTTDYSRLRIGVDAPAEGEAVDYVLGRFRPSEIPVMKDALSLATQAVHVWIRRGIET